MGRGRWKALILLIILPHTCLASKLIEKHSYTVYFGILKVGYAYTKLYQIDNSTYNATAFARTPKLIDIFYKVRDRMESLFTKDHLVKYKAKIREGGYKRDDLILYDEKQQLLTYIRNGKVKKKFQIPPPIFDMLSSYYAFRLRRNYKMKITSGKKVAVPTVKSEGMVTLKIRGKTVKALKLRLLASVKGILLSRNPKKWTTLYLDPQDMHLIAALVPTKWGNIKIIKSD